MALSPVLSDFVLVITAVVLFYAAMTDLKEFKIRNELIIATIHAVAAKFGLVKVQQTGDHKLIPFAPTVAAALITAFMLGCLQPNTYVIRLSQNLPPTIGDTVLT